MSRVMPIPPWDTGTGFGFGTGFFIVRQRAGFPARLSCSERDHGLADRNALVGAEHPHRLPVHRVGGGV